MGRRRERIIVSDLLEIVVGAVLVIVTYAFYLGILFAFIWAVWNYIIMPSVPELMRLL